MYWVPLAVGDYYYLNLPSHSLPNGDSSRKRIKSGVASIQAERFTLLDDERHTPAYSRHAGQPHRELHGEIWQPTRRRRDPSPLVIYSHGFMSSRREALYLARFLARHGYTVAAVDYPLTCLSRAPGKPWPGDIVNQPADISHLIDYMLWRNENPADRLYGTIDPGKIAVAGLSYGALTAMLATQHRRWRDTRIKANICIAGPTSMLSGKFYTRKSTPSLLIYGDADSIIHYEQHALPVMGHLSKSTLVTLKKGSHTGFAQHASTFLRMLKNPDSLACAALRLQLDKKPWDFVDELGGSAVGIVPPLEDIVPLTRPLVRRAMKASRQQMFTSLAAHAFLESQFAVGRAQRDKARKFLYQTLPAENADEVAVA